MSNVIPFIADPMNFEAIPEIRRQSEDENNRRISRRLRSIGYVFPVSVKFLGLQPRAERAARAELQADNKMVPAELMEQYESAVREA